MSDVDYSETDDDPTYCPSTEELDDDMSEDDIAGVPPQLLRDSISSDGRVYFHNSQLYAHGNDSEGEENLRRMERGQAPIGSDGLPINLHHGNQEDDAPRVEVLQTFHQRYYSELHPRLGEPSQINRKDFGREREEYWKGWADVYRNQNRENQGDK